MKKKLKSLYRTERVEQTWDDLSRRDELDDYLTEAERIACKALQDAGHDDVATYSEDWHLRYVDVVREDLSPEARHAIEIMWHVRTLRDQLERNNARGAAVEAIRLAQHVEHFNVDRAFLKPVQAGSGTIKGGRKGAKATHGTTGSKAAKYRVALIKRREAHPNETKKESYKAVAVDCGLYSKNSYKTIERAAKGL